jgi:hypothetical protein
VAFGGTGGRASSLDSVPLLLGPLFGYEYKPVVSLAPRARCSETARRLGEMRFQNWQEGQDIHLRIIFLENSGVATAGIATAKLSAGRALEPLLGQCNLKLPSFLGHGNLQV